MFPRPAWNPAPTKWWSPGNAVAEGNVVNGVAKTGNQACESTVSVTVSTASSTV
jgi:hypothetical protein